jgi:hypothetical protein
MARMAGNDITASPSQLVARTQSRDTEEGLKATEFQDSSGLTTVNPQGLISSDQARRRRRQITRPVKPKPKVDKVKGSGLIVSTVDWPEPITWPVEKATTDNGSLMLK